MVLTWLGEEWLDRANELNPPTTTAFRARQEIDRIERRSFRLAERHNLEKADPELIDEADAGRSGAGSGDSSCGSARGRSRSFTSPARRRKTRV